MSIFNKVQILARAPLLRRSNFFLRPGDTLRVTISSHHFKDDVVVDHRVTEQESFEIDEAVIFSGELDGRRAVGGALLEKKKG